MENKNEIVFDKEIAAFRAALVGFVGGALAQRFGLEPSVGAIVGMAVGLAYDFAMFRLKKWIIETAKPEGPTG